MNMSAPDSSPIRRNPALEGARRTRSAPIVVGIDGGPATNTVLHAAADAAELAGTRLIVVHAAETPVLSPSLVGVADPELPQDCEAVLFPDVVEVLARRNLRWSLVAEYGDPAYLLTRLAQELGARAIVIGSHTSGLLGRLRAIGGHSVADRLVRRPPVPVYIVPSRPPGPGASYFDLKKSARGGRTDDLG